MLDVHDQLAFVNIKDSTDKEVHLKTMKYPVKLNQEHLLGFAVRDRLINVAVNGRLLFTFTLPTSRQLGKIAIINAGATAVFDDFRMEALSADVKLVPDR